MNQPLLTSLIILGYFTLLILIAHFTAKGANNSTYFTGNRNMAWPMVALAMVTAPISGLTFISVPGMVATKGYSYMQMCLGFVAGYFIIGWVLVPLFYKHNIISIYSFLEQRFGTSAYKTGAWMFLVSEILGIGVRFMVVCVVLQLLVFQPMGLPFIINVVATMFLIWLYTAGGGVKSVIWSDMVKSCTLILSVILCFYFLTTELGLSFKQLPQEIINHSSSKVFFFDDFKDSSYFWKQFITGMFLVVAMTGLDQDMMQRILACRDYRGSRKNLAVSGILQFFVISLFLVLGTLLLLYMDQHSIPIPEKTDDIFATVAYHSTIPAAVGILFIIGIVSASYSSVGSALTSLTTSYTIDILGASKKHNDVKLKKLRQIVHGCMALLMAMVIIVCYYLNKQDAITALFTLASYTYGPILGLFVFGIFSNRQIQAKLIPLICISAPLLSWIIGWSCKELFDYNMGFELFLINTSLTLGGLYILPSATAESSSRSLPPTLTLEDVL